MGLDAFVPCNCLKEGKTTEPPVDKAWITYDTDGYYGLNPDYSTDAELKKKVEEWSEDCCSHPDMNIGEHICNWSGLRIFQQALTKVGAEYFPVLTSQLPNTNGGSLSVENAQHVLNELEKFEQKIHSVSNYYLVNDDNNQAIYDYIDVYQGKIVLSKPYSLGFNSDGLYIVESETNQIIFQGLSVSQKVYTYPDWLIQAAKVFKIKLKPIRKVGWINNQTKARFYTPWGLDVAGHYPKEFTVEQRAVDIEDYHYIIGQLRKICEISIQMNNPVFWC